MSLQPAVHLQPKSRRVRYRRLRSGKRLRIPWSKRDTVQKSDGPCAGLEDLHLGLTRTPSTSRAPSCREVHGPRSLLTRCAKAATCGGQSRARERDAHGASLTCASCETWPSPCCAGKHVASPRDRTPPQRTGHRRRPLARQEARARRAPRKGEQGTLAQREGRARVCDGSAASARSDTRARSAGRSGRHLDAADAHRDGTAGQRR